MTQVTIITENVSEFLYLSGYDENKIKQAIKSESFAIHKLTLEDIKRDKVVVDYQHPYRIYNPCNFDLEI